MTVDSIAGYSPNSGRWRYGSPATSEFVRQHGVESHPPTMDAKPPKRAGIVMNLNAFGPFCSHCVEVYMYRLLSEPHGQYGCLVPVCGRTLWRRVRDSSEPIARRESDEDYQCHVGRGLQAVQ